MKFVIPGNPTPYAAPEFIRRGRKVWTRNKRASEKAIAQKHLSNQIRKAFDSHDKEIVMEASNLAYNRAYEVRVTFYLPIPKSLSLGQKNAKLWGLEFHNVKPDSDNLSKFAKDCAKEIIFPDDSQIVISSEKKVYSENPRTEIEIMAIKPKKPPTEQVFHLIAPTEMDDLIVSIRNLLQSDPFNNWNDIATDVHNVEFYLEFAQALLPFAEKYAPLFKKLEKIAAKKEEKN